MQARGYLLSMSNAQTNAPTDLELAMAGKLAPPDGKWEVDFGDGDGPSTLDVSEFIADNAETMWSEMAGMYHCQPGDVVDFGGGCTPSITVKRIS